MATIFQDGRHAASISRGWSKKILNSADLNDIGALLYDFKDYWNDFLQFCSHVKN